jgi:hypothetical protein
LIAPLTNFTLHQFLERIVTADETWVHQAQIMGWKRPTSPVAILREGDTEGTILVHFTAKGETVNSQNYRGVLRTKLKPVI